MMATNAVDFCHLNGRYSKNPGTPWIPRAKDYLDGLIGLHEESEDFVRWIQPTTVERSIRELVYLQVKAVILNLWPDATVDCFGSFRTNLYLPTSDIDMVVMGTWSRPPLQCLAQELLRWNIVEPDQLNVLDKASVPIVKLVHRETKVKVDISFNMEYCVNSATFVMECMRTYPPLRKLVFILKQFLLQRCLNEVFLGGLGSYGLTLMIVSFLQLHPTLDTHRDDLNLGVLLVEFFELYGRHFNYASTAIRVTGGGCYLSKDEYAQQVGPTEKPALLCIIDPAKPSNDVGRSCYGILKVKHAFEYAYLMLTEVLDNPDSEPIRDGNSLLGRVIRVNKETVEYRQWVHENFSSRFLPLVTYPVPYTGMTRDGRPVVLTKARAFSHPQPGKADGNHALFERPQRAFSNVLCHQVATPVLATPYADGPIFAVPFAGQHVQSCFGAMKPRDGLELSHAGPNNPVSSTAGRPQEVNSQQSPPPPTQYVDGCPQSASGSVDDGQPTWSANVNGESRLMTSNVRSGSQARMRCRSFRRRPPIGPQR